MYLEYRSSRSFRKNGTKKATWSFWEVLIATKVWLFREVERTAPKAPPAPYFQGSPVNRQDHFTLTTGVQLHRPSCVAQLWLWQFAYVVPMQFCIVPLQLWLVSLSHLQLVALWEKYNLHNLHAQSLSCVRLFATPWTIACQAPLSVEFSWQE